MAYSPRTDEAGIWDNPYAYDITYNPGAQNYIWLPNCTSYAYFRAVEISGGQVDYNTIFGGGFPNASNWYSDALWSKSPNYQDIRLGDIVCWGVGGGVGAAGHVAVVEAIDTNYVYTSNSHYMVTGQTKTWPGTDAKRYFEYARHPKDMSTYTRLYNYNANGSYGSSPSYWTCPNFLGCIHNPYADITPPEPPVPPEDDEAALFYYFLNSRKKGGSIVVK